MLKICKRFTIISVLFLNFMLNAQNQFNVEKYANFERYREANMNQGDPLTDENRVVFMGNSITEMWSIKSPDFFKDNGYINRGISGQVTHQMLLRFRADVIDLKPKVVVILAGINDLAQNSGFVEVEEIADNIYTMAELADNHGIKVIICSVLPAIGFSWRHDLKPAEKIIELNERLKEYTKKKDFVYVDYYSEMVDEKGGLKVPDFTTADDMVHPNENGYKVMESVVKPILANALGE